MNERRALKPDAQPFDEIRIKTVPRYKMSEMSGDEWRISARIEFLRKGKKVFEDSYSALESAVAFLPGIYATEGSGRSGFYAGEGNVCDQEGCSELADHKYRLKKSYCRDGHPAELKDVVYRLFCDRHATRGDCGLEDSDKNYEKMSYEAPTEVVIQ